MSLVTQLNPVEDPDDCRSIKAYNYGAAIGIIVAVIVVLALLIGGWIYWYRRSSRQGVYEPHHDIHMQPFPEGSAGQAYNDQGYSSSSLPAQQTSSTDRMHPGYPASGVGKQQQNQLSSSVILLNTDGTKLTSNRHQSIYGY
ncbi:MAG: hypothetical protein FRX49_09365 [Trebouxia sp. A1-2]|nr:MAG: hypothetical protein FRX49_09365 [Trebouxia sp. A1-2]